MPDEGELRSSLEGVSETLSRDLIKAHSALLKKFIYHLERIQLAAAK